MGCGQSNEAEGKNTEGLRLMSSKLHFRPDQLEKLNDYFGHLVKTDSEVSSEISGIEAAVERLVQRLIVGVGNLDRRFSAGFLVSLNERRRIKQLRFEYLLRLDALSRPSDAELPLSVEEENSLPGFARLRLRTGNAGAWAEFVGPDTRLRRDLVKARIAALLAAALKEDAISGADERLCMTPGQVVDAEVLDKILKQPRHCRLFYGPAGSESKLPEIGDHRVAIVEDESGIILKIGLNGSKTQDIQVRLLIGASVNSWPSSADYPKRIPLHHCDALLHYTAAQSGMYVVAVGPHQGLRCEDRASLWRIRVPAAETIMSNYYSDESIVKQTESVLLQILDQLRGRKSLDFSVRRKGSLRLVSRHIVRAAHWWSLERSGPDPLRNWAADTLSRHVLRTLDELLRALKCQNLRCYFQPRCNLMLQCARGGTLQQEDAYAADARIIESYLTSLHAYSAEWLENPERKLSSSELLERELLIRWSQVMASLPRGTMSGHHGYGNHQLQYLGLVVGQVLRAKDSLNQESFDNCSSFFNLSTDSQAGEGIENLVYLMTLVLKQAKEQVQVTSFGHRRRKRKRRRSKAERKRSCARAYFDRSVDVLVDVVRKDRDTAYLDLENETILAKTLLKWLYFGMEEDKKVLGPLLRPYLGNLFNGSHELAWHVESWRSRQEAYNAEMHSLGLFCKLVTAREILPANGIVESLTKGWAWAESVARMIERISSADGDNGLRLIFLTPERILRYQLKFAGGKDKGSCFSSWRRARSVAARRPSLARTSMITATDTLPGLSRRSEADALHKGVAGHVELREASPLTFVAAMARRRGRQRAPGGLIPALVTLNKFRVLQEVAQVLPADECTSMLELVQKVSRESSRRLRRASCPDTSSVDGSVHRQLYTPRSESKLYEVPRQSSSESREEKIILERQLQVRREISEIHDTLTRGLRSRSQLPVWDSTSLTSTWTSSVGSLGRGRLKKHRAPLWDTVRGTSALWDSVSCNSTFTKVKLREDTPNALAMELHQSNNNRKVQNYENNKLPSWELLEKVLNKKCLSFEYIKSDSCEENEDVNVDYLFISNDTKEIPMKSS
ncbi:hypothetical protein TSAR_006653 [Trichomalopsis sarcophagae]|uniref:Mab-21-like HhH/H2TH-like domain-containing protein n=1 Tax=Trichomalopsis sarcophagae TaxID=543379 RepID=A0A232EWY6_9HYME|nr:hypothetical protein TSAR_006653 [Trichomalopsis sarcophagae]